MIAKVGQITRPNASHRRPNNTAPVIVLLRDLGRDSSFFDVLSPSIFVDVPIDVYRTSLQDPHAFSKEALSQQTSSAHN